MVANSIRKVAPDGGYGWVVAGAYALHHLLVIPILQGFGLIYKDTFRDLNFTATETGLILNTCGAFSMLCGIVGSPLLRRFGFRKVAFMGAFFLTSGILLTSHATTFTHFMIAHGFITSLGMGLGFSSYPVALNTYFTKKRAKAAGYTMTIAGIGPVFMPQLISFLLSFYGTRGAMIVLGGIIAHAFISSLLLQPVQRYMKEEIEGMEDSNTQLAETEDSRFDTEGSRRKISREISREVDIEAMFSMDSAFSQSMLTIAENLQRQNSAVSTKSHVSDIVKIKLYDPDGNMVEEVEPLQALQEEEEDEYEETSRKKSLFSRMCKYVVDMFDLTLLKDPIYLNIMLGMSLAVFAEMNFSVLTPLIIGDYNLSTQQIATFMSVVSCTDICCRFLAPYVGECLNQSHRVLYLFSLLLLILSRFALLVSHQYYPLLMAAAGIGIARGFRTVYTTLVIPSYVPIERLASALGIQMAVNGVFVFLGGPAIGFIRDVTGTYVNCIYVINGVTFTAFVMWSVELLYMRYKTKS